MPKLSKRDQEAKVSSNEARRRKEVALAELREIQVKERHGELVDAEKARAETEARFRADADALLNLPARIAAEFAAELGVDERVAQKALDRRIREFMRERSMVGTRAAESKRRTQMPQLQEEAKERQRRGGGDKKSQSARSVPQEPAEAISEPEQKGDTRDIATAKRRPRSRKP